MCGNNELKFSIFLIHSLAKEWKKTPKEVYDLLDQTKILDDYIISCYDSLHSLGKEYQEYGMENMDYKYLVEDLIENEPELFELYSF